MSDNEFIVNDDMFGAYVRIPIGARMADFIDREALIKAFSDAEPDIMADYGPEHGSEWGFSRAEIERIIKGVSAGDAAPVVHGRWKLIRRLADGANMECSVCGREYTFNSFFRAENCTYCHCGAKMDLSKEG